MFDSEPEAIDALALLYASGVLEDKAAAAFEQRLGEDQAARETLCQAVQLLHVLCLQPAVEPNPAYREEVRRRLRQQRPRNRYRGHPLLWAILGAAAAAVLLLFLPTGLCPHRAPSSTDPIAAPPAAASDVDGRRRAQPHEESRRRLRVEEHPPVRYSEQSALPASPMLEH
jgi:anti-sigma-K factor RskA